MTDLPVAGHMVNAAITQASFKLDIEAQRTVIAELPGAAIETAITIDASDQITPVVGVGSYSVIVNTGSLDTLSKIVPTNCRNGMILQLRCADPAKPITVWHRVGGANQISLLGDQNYVLDDDDKCIWVMWNDSTDVWEEVAPGSMRPEILRLPGYAEATNVIPATDVITVSQFLHTVEPQSGTADNVQEINFQSKGTAIVRCRLKDAGDVITWKHNTGAGDKIYLVGGADVAMSQTYQYIDFEKRGNDAYEVARYGFDKIIGSPDLCFARMSLSSSDPYAEGAGSSLYIHPVNGNCVSLKDTTLGEWFERPLTSMITKAIPSTIRRLYNVYLYWTGTAIDVEFDPWDASPTTGTITGASAATSCVITATNTLSVGDCVYIEGITGTIGTDTNSGINGKMHVVTAATGANFTLGGVVTTGLAWTSGGTFYKVPLTEATGKVFDSGIRVKSGNASRRWIGLLMTNATSGQSQVSQTNGICLVANIYNTRTWGLVGNCGTANSYNGGLRPWGNFTKPRVALVNPIAGLRPIICQLQDSVANGNNSVGNLVAYANWTGTGGAPANICSYPQITCGGLGANWSGNAENSESAAGMIDAGCNYIHPLHYTSGGLNSCNFQSLYITVKFPWG